MFAVLSLLVRDSYDPVAPPFLAGLLTPLLPKSVLVLLAMVTGVVVGGTPGAPPTPAYRALGPAVVAAGGAVIGLFLLALSRDAGNAISVSDDSYSSGGDVFSPGALWVVTGAAVAIMLFGLHRRAIARPQRSRRGVMIVDVGGCALIRAPGASSATTSSGG
ncbi:hypothetical protein GCM10010399_07650 [Dactylosporangium fulvum]|uniref:Uncharacterized protein n=1 Tax=Dactylosporangium fulvum TaxID=53359 RepID=A0ABY5WAT0_9ACTN|nr:hypothetical protein [Dactylosporangium fulvum]UWP86589.1 hypothetical protein Dfulv_21055 [Dactylosporangium fulvum]